MRYVKVLAAASVFAIAMQPSAQAATPADGTLSESKRTLAWSGGPFYFSQPTLGGDCLGGSDDPTCDYYALTVNLSEGARIRISVKTPTPNSDEGLNGVDGDDYDLFVYSPTGTLVAESANPRGNETVEFRHRARFSGKPYEVRVTPWLVRPGSTYKGSVEALSLGS